MKIYCTARNAASASVRFEHAGSQRIQGSIRGPFCKYSRTLPATVPIRDGQALVVDPCYWTSGLPFRYEITLDESEGVAAQQFMWGIRWCVPHQQNLLVDGKGYVVRAAGWQAGFELEAFRDARCALFTKTRLDSGIYERASELGVLIVDASATPDANVDSPASENTFQREPSVHFTLVQRGAANLAPSDALRMVAVQDDLNARIGDQANKHIEPGSRADVGLVDESQIQSSTRDLSKLPLLVERQIDSTSLINLRRGCDLLQSDLAPRGQFAGYLLTGSS